MRPCSALAALFLFISACQNNTSDRQTHKTIEGTWQLLSGMLIKKGDTTITDYTGDIRMIKIINETHFSFLNHDLKKGSDSTAAFSAGGGPYTLAGDQYTEYLEYCSYREWEGNTFEFTISFQGDTLIQQGVEKIEKLAIERVNIEKYQRVRAR